LTRRIAATQPPPHIRDSVWYWCSRTPGRYSAQAPTAARCPNLFHTPQPTNSCDDIPNYHPMSSTPLQRRQPHTPPLAGEAVGAVYTAPTTPAYPPTRTCQGERRYAPGPWPALDTIEPVKRTTAEWYSPLVAEPQTRRNPRHNPGKKTCSTTHLIPLACQSELTSRE
jgi:hypothetical protein